jgi:hypothetical protein
MSHGHSPSVFVDIKNSVPKELAVAWKRGHPTIFGLNNKFQCLDLKLAKKDYWRLQCLLLTAKPCCMSSTLHLYLKITWLVSPAKENPLNSLAFHCPAANRSSTPKLSTVYIFTCKLEYLKKTTLGQFITPRQLRHQN